MKVEPDWEKYVADSKEEWYRNLRDIIERWTQEGFEMGIDIEGLSIRDNFIQVLDPNKFGYGDRYRIPAPDWKTVETDFGTVQIKQRDNQSYVQDSDSNENTVDPKTKK